MAEYSLLSPPDPSKRRSTVSEWRYGRCLYSNICPSQADPVNLQVEKQRATSLGHAVTMMNLLSNCCARGVSLPITASAVGPHPTSTHSMHLPLVSKPMMPVPRDCCRLVPGQILPVALVATPRTLPILEHISPMVAQDGGATRCWPTGHSEPWPQRRPCSPSSWSSYAWFILRSLPIEPTNPQHP